MIMKHARIIASAAARVESANARARANALAGWPVYGSASAPSIFEEKSEDPEDIKALLSTLATSLQVDNALRETRTDLHGDEMTTSSTAGVEAALARLIASEQR